MGNIDLSKMGFSGKMGNIVAYVVNGQQRFRTFTEPRNPKTPKQTAHRSRFGFVSNKVSPLFAQIKIGYKIANVFQCLFGFLNKKLRICFRPKYYKYFDSFKAPILPDIEFMLYNKKAASSSKD